MTPMIRKRCRILIELVAAGSLMPFGACASVAIAPDSSAPPIVVHLQPDRAWTDTDVVVQRGARLFFNATGEIFWAARSATAGPDGVKGIPGWSIGDGGLVGQVTGTNATFQIGARTQPFLDRNLRSRRTYAPPPIVMPAAGRLRLGFKNFQPGANRGDFAVTIRPAG
jgi:hypothetical protein